MKFLKRLSINLKFNLLISTVVAVLFVVFAFYIVNWQTKQAVERNKIQMNKELQDLEKVVKLHLTDNKDKLKVAIEVAQFALQTKGSIQVDTSTRMPLRVTNQLTRKSKDIMLPRMSINDNDLFNNQSIIEEIKILANVNTFIYQRVPEGYVSIATNVLKNDGKLATGVLIPNTSPVVKTIERTEVFIGRSLIDDQWYLAAYKPIKSDDATAGIISVMIPEASTVLLKELFDFKNYLSKGYPFLVSQSGKMTIHPTRERSDISETKLFENILQSRTEQNMFRLTWPEDETGTDRFFHALYMESIDSYLCITYESTEIESEASEHKSQIIFALMLVLLLIILVNTLLVKALTKRIKHIVRVLKQIALGNQTEMIQVSSRDELSSIALASNELIDSFGQVLSFAKELEKGNLSAQYQATDTENALGTSLLNMRNRLLNAEEQSVVRQREESRQNWITKGQADFAQILRYNYDSMDELGYQIVLYLIKYLNANQGGVFVVNEISGDRKVFEMVACHAYDQRKLVQKTIPVEVGQLGRAYREQKTVLMTDVPADYLEISSGLGATRPSWLAVVPLKSNFDILGAIEISSFNKLEEYYIVFLEMVAESIAMTLSTVRVNEKTALLLEQSKQQADELTSKEEMMRENLEELKVTQEEALRREQQMRSIVDALNTATYTIEYDLFGNVINANEAFCDLIDVPLQEILEMHHREGLDLSEEQEKEYEKFWEDLRDGITKTDINRIEINNRVVWLNETYCPIMGHDGKPEKILKISFDITQTKQQQLQLSQLTNDLKAKEQELRSNMQELELIQRDLIRKEADMRGTLDAIDFTLGTIEIDINGTIVRANEQIAKLLQINADDLRGISHYSLLDKDVVNEDEYDERTEKLRSGKPVQSESLYKTDKQQAWFFESYTPIKDRKGRYSKVLILLNDINIRKKQEIELKQKSLILQNTEKELKQQIEQYQNIQQNVAQKEIELNSLLSSIGNSMLLIEYDLQGNVLSANNFFLQLFDIEANNLIGRNHSDINDLVTTGALYKEFWQNLRDGYTQKETTYYHIKNTQKWFSEIYSPIRDQQGNIQRILAIGVDVSKSKQQEEQIKEVNLRLLSQQEESRQNLEEMQTIRESLHEAEHLLHNITSHLCSFEISNKGYIISANKQFVDLLGESENKVKNSDYFSLTEGILFTQEHYDDILKKLQAGTSIHNTVAYKHKQTTHYLDQYWMPITDMQDQLQKIVVVGVDVTALHTSKKELEQAKKLLNEQQTQNKQLRYDVERFNILKNNTLHYELSPDGIITSVNENFATLLGLSDKKIIGRTYQKSVATDSITNEQYAIMIENLRRGNRFERLSKYVTTNNILWLHEIFIPLSDDKEHVYNIMVFACNVSDSIKKS